MTESCMGRRAVLNDLEKKKLYVFHLPGIDPQFVVCFACVLACIPITTLLPQHRQIHENPLERLVASKLSYRINISEFRLSPSLG